MKWFQVDADTPGDPKIKAVVRELGPAGMGALFFLWCHIADHGTRRAGWSLNSLGHPIPVAELQEVSRLTESEFIKLTTICTSTGHWLKRPWDMRQVIAIPAMTRRADTYTKRQMRRGGEVSSNNGRSNFDNSTVQTVHTKKNPPTPLSAKGGAPPRLTRHELKDARTILNQRFGRCEHEPECAGTQVCVRAIALERKLKAEAS